MVQLTKHKDFVAKASICKAIKNTALKKAQKWAALGGIDSTFVVWDNYLQELQNAMW